MRALRIVLVTAGLTAAGAVFGAIAGAVAAAAWILVGEAHVFLWEPAIVILAGYYGGLLGAVLGPAAAWLMMRHVPLWLAVGGTTLGTMAGGIVGLLLGGPGLVLLSGVVGFVMAAAYLQIIVPRGGRLLRGHGASGQLPAGGG